MNKQTLKTICTVLTFGSLWGIAEATLGHLLHTIYFPATGAILFFIGLILMMLAYSNTASRSTVVLMSVVAATLKLSNLMMLGTLAPTGVINPAISIILEGVLFAVALGYITIKRPYAKLSALIERATTPTLAAISLTLAIIVELYI